MKRARKPAQEHGKYVRGEHVGADGETLFTRVQAARFLCVQRSTVRMADNRGALRSIVIKGVHLYTRDDLEQFRASRGHGSVAAKAFAMFAAGRSPADVVLELEVAPSVVEEWATSYAKLSEGVLCIGPKGSRAAWQHAFGVELRPALVLRALELAARTPSVRARLLAS